MAKHLTAVVSLPEAKDASDIKVSTHRVALKTTVEKANGILFAPFACPYNGEVRSISIRADGNTVTGTAALTMVSPELDPVGAELTIFVENIEPAATGTSMYRKVEITNTGYDVLDKDKGAKIYALFYGSDLAAGDELQVFFVVDAG